MRRFHIICVSLILSIYSYGQQKPFLEKSSFSNLNISESWIMVKYRSELASRATTRTVQSIRPVKYSKPSILDGLVKMKIDGGVDPVDACNELLKDPNVIYAEPIVMDRPLYDPSDPFTSSQYYLDNIQAYDAWNITRGDDDIIIGIIDTGVDMDHDDLVSSLWTNEADPVDGIDNDENGYVDDYWGYDFANGDNDPEADQSSHGVRVAGIAGASTDNNNGMAGIGFNSRIAALKGFRSEDGLSSGLFEAILYAADNGIQVLNLSWGSIRQPLQSEQDIINYAVLEKDVIVVAAAGNDGNLSTEEEKFYPASYDNVLSVAGSDADDGKWSGSSFNHAVDLMAPASSILSTVSGGGYNSSGGFGTSFAAPMVAAAAALVKDQFPTLTAQQVMERVRATADDVYSIGTNLVYDGKLGKGRLNIYRAVSESNVKSLRAEYVDLSSPFPESIFFGDTVQVTANLRNFLTPLNDPAIYISAPDDNFNALQQSLFPGFLNTLDSAEISFQVVLEEDIEPGSNVAIRLDYADGSYSDFQHIEFATSPDYVDFGNDAIQLTVEGNGNLGLSAYGENETGSGLIFQSDTLLKYAGIMLATGNNTVSDNIISNYNSLTREDDFQNRLNYKLYRHPGADHFGYSEFTDPVHNLIIEQSSLAWENEDFVIIRYRIINNSPDAINNLSFGVYADWDLDVPSENFAEYDATKNYLYARNASSTIFSGTQVLGSGSSIYSAMDLDAENGNTSDLTEDFSDSVKYEFLVNEFRPQAGTEGNGNNIAGIHGISITELDPYADTFINVVYAASDSRTGLESAFSSAETRLNQFLLTPRVQETINVCNGTEFDLDPAEGTNFEFYEDVLGTSLLATGNILTVSDITSDTSFYVRNIDEVWKSDIFEIQLRLFGDIADFELSTDTLYLDNPTTNVVQFTDLSQGAVSWQWDFGQGSQSTTQNPALSFNQPGNYDITLRVENEEGCIDTATRTLVVSERPEDPVFEEYLICPGTFVTLNNTEATSLRVFARENQNTPERQGATVEIGPIDNDSTVFISAIINGFETSKVPVAINVYNEVADFMVIPDTLSESLQLRAIANFDPASTISWLIDGSPAGSGEVLSIDATMGATTITLEVQTENGCTITKETEISINSSPTPSVQNLTGCNGESVTLIPENGTYFAFYEDSKLTSLITKGTQLTVQESQTIYVAGLDDGLPGIPAEVTITLEDFELNIQHEVTSVGNKNRVDLSAISNQTISSYQWYVNDLPTEISATPSLFFDNNINEVVLEAVSELGCLGYDTLQLDFTPPLGISPSGSISIFPNPTDGITSISSSENTDLVTVLDLSGKEIAKFETVEKQIDLTPLKEGIYLLEFYLNEKYERLKVIIEK